LENRFAGQGYGALKTELAEVVVEHLTPIRERAVELLSDKAQLDALLAVGAEKANEIAEQTLAKVYDRLGFVRP
jgi:tryptophanyl-tRNA synthetase